MDRAVQTFKTKYDGRSKPAWHGIIVEERGAWMAVYFADPPSWNGRPDDTVHAVTFYSTELPLCVLVALDKEGVPLEYQCDAGLPATFEGGEMRFVDLELDLIAGPDLRYYLRDEDEFQDNREAMGYPPGVSRAAWEGIRIADELLSSGGYPFDGSAERLGRSAGS